MVPFLIAVGLLALAYFVGSFGWSQILICGIFGIPYAADLARKNILTADYARHVVIKYRRAQLIWAVMLLALSALVVALAKTPLYLSAYGCGLAISFLLILGRSGPTTSNIDDFVGSHFSHLNLGEDGDTPEKAATILRRAEEWRTIHLRATRQKWPGKTD